MGGKSASGNAGYKYYFGIHAGIGRGECDELVEIRIGEKLAWQGRMAASGDGYIDAPDLFGGDKKEGGIQGPFKLLMGEPTQTMPAELAAMIAPVPATGFRRMATFFFDGLVCALNPYPKPWSFRMRRAIKGWDGPVLRPELAIIDLEGPDPTTVTSVPYGDAVQAVLNVQGPTANAVQARVVPSPGDTINSVDFAWLYDPFANNQIDDPTPLVAVPFLSTVPQPDGSVLVNFNPRYYLKGGYEGKVQFNTYGTDAQGRKQLKNLLAKIDIVVNPLTVRVAPPGFTVTNVVSIQGVPIVSQVINGDGTATVKAANYPDGEFEQNGEAAYALFDGRQGGVGLVVRFSHLLDIERDFTIDPIIIEVVVPAGGKLVQIVDVTISTQLQSPDNPQQIGESIPFTVVEGNKVRIVNVRAAGVPIAITYVYVPKLNPSAPTIPDKQIRAMNPAHIVFEALTNREWGRGWDRSIINIASFEQAMQTLFDEKFGLCYKWSRRDSIDTFVQDVLDTIGAVIYSDPRTALMTIKLIRADYNVSTMKVWDTTNGIIEITASNVNTSSVTVNEMIVKYRETVYNEDRAVNVQNLASIQSNGGVMNTVTKEYKGIPTTGLARRVAQRDLRARAEGLRRFTLVMDRRASDTTPGGLIRIQDTARNIPPTVCRIATKKEGTLTDGRITLEVVQDVFSFPAASFVGDQPNSWVMPNFAPCLGEHEVFELPYFLLKRRMSQADFAYTTNQSAFLGVVAERAKSTNIGYDTAVRTGGIDASDWPASGDEMYCGYEPPAV